MSEKDPKAEFEKYKQKKKSRIIVPPEFLQEAKSYEDKLVLVKMLTEKEKGRVLLMIKSMLDRKSTRLNSSHT